MYGLCTVNQFMGVTGLGQVSIKGNNAASQCGHGHVAATTPTVVLAIPSAHHLPHHLSAPMVIIPCSTFVLSSYRCRVWSHVLRPPAVALLLFPMSSLFVAAAACSLLLIMPAVVLLVVVIE